MNRSKIEDELFISDIDHVRNEDVDEMYEHIITLCRNDLESVPGCPTGYQHFPLWDDDVQQQDEFDRAVGATLKALRNDGSVLVHCIAGISRSPAVVVTALAHRDGRRFEQVRQDVWAKRPSISINTALKNHGTRFLGETEHPFSG